MVVLEFFIIEKILMLNDALRGIFLMKLICELTSLLDMQLTDILIFGHTHRTYIDVENRVVNTGTWIADMLVPFHKHSSNN